MPPHLFGRLGQVQALLYPHRPGRLVCLPCCSLPTTAVCKTLSPFGVLFQLLWQPADASPSEEEVKRKGKGPGRERGAEYKRPDNLFTDRVSIDLHVVVITMTISGLMASLKGSSMNWERVQLKELNQIQSVRHVSVQSIKPALI